MPINWRASRTVQNQPYISAACIFFLIYSVHLFNKISQWVRVYLIKHENILYQNFPFGKFYLKNFLSMQIYFRHIIDMQLKNKNQ